MKKKNVYIHKICEIHLYIQSLYPFEKLFRIFSRTYKTKQTLRRNQDLYKAGINLIAIAILSNLLDSFSLRL